MLINEIIRASHGASTYEKVDTFRDSVSRILKAYPGLSENDIQVELDAILNTKSKNILQPYGSQDKIFSGLLGPYRHIHLTNLGINPPIVLIYDIEGQILRYYKIVKHKTYWKNDKGANKLKKDLDKIKKLLSA